MENFFSPRIWDNRVPSPNSYVRILRSFVISNPPPTATLYITADSNYTVWINGRFVGFDQYGDFPFDKVYDTYDVRSFLRQGENVIAILGYCTDEDCSVYCRGVAGVSFALIGGGGTLAESDASCYVSPAPEYISGPIHKFSPQLSFGFCYNATLYDGWHDDGYTRQGDWVAAEPQPGWENLRPRPIRQLKLYDPRNAVFLAGGEFRDSLPLSENPAIRMRDAALSLYPVEQLTGCKANEARAPLDPAKGLHLTADRGDGIWCIFDLESEDAGLFTLDIDCDRDVRIDIGFGEHLTDGRVRTAIGSRSFAGAYLCRGGREQFIHYFRRFGCRYIELHICAHEATLYYAGITPSRYPVEFRGDFRPADRLHRRIFEVCRHTLLTCMHEHYEDCPWREQALYAMDSRNQMLCGYYVFGEYEFARANLVLLARSQRPDGLLELCAPAGFRKDVDIPCFSLVWVVACMEYCLYAGDLSLAAEILPTAKRLMSAFAEHRTPEGLAGWIPGLWNFYEWADGLSGDTHRKYSPEQLTGDALISAFYYLALGAMDKLCGWAGERGHEYAAQMAPLAAAVNRLFWDEKRGLYASYIVDGEHTHYCELCQSLLLYSGICSDKKRRRLLLDTLADKNNDLVRVTLSHAIFKYESLLSDERYAAAVFEEIADKWGNQLYNGATTFWETEKGAADFDDAGSLCHAWSATPAYLYFAYVMGIRPTKPGFAAKTKAPLKTNILAADAVLPTPKGDLGFKMRQDAGKPYLRRI